MLKAVSSSKVHQGILQEAVQQLFPNEYISTNSRKNSSVKGLQRYLELDFWIPKYQLGFEFQDEHHYTTTWYYHHTPEEVKDRDDSKQEIVREQEVTQVTVPCWWDGKLGSLIASICHQRPDLSDKWEPTDLEISLNPPIGFFGGFGVPDIGELMLASFPMETSYADEISSENAWWIGEKYDGLRCCWNPSRNELYTRSGVALQSFHRFSDLLPDNFIDGEVWFGRGNFYYAQKFIGVDESYYQQYFRMIAFDVPCAHPFEERYYELAQHLAVDHPYAVLAPRLLCTSKAPLNKLMSMIIDNDGEGIILRKTGSYYENGRSESLLKIKAARYDAEAFVTAVREDNSLELKLPNATTIFEIPSSNIVKDLCPRKGDVVTFYFDNYSPSGVPVNPTVRRIRTDVSWNEVVLLSHRDQSEKNFISQPYGHWSRANGENMRIFFENFAMSHNFDPLIPENWYSIPRQYIEEIQGGSTIMKKLKGGYIGALRYLFPDIGLNPHKFPLYAQVAYLENVDNRRQYLDNFASENGFEPLIPENWYPVTADQGTGSEIQGILNTYEGSLAKALDHLYPEIEWDFDKFLPGEYWEDWKNRRNFFETFASEKRFDPLKPDNWTRVTRKDVENVPGGKAVLAFYRGNFASAIIELFPELHETMNTVDLNYANKKQFFENFAKSERFDPLVPESWYPIKNSAFLSYEGASGILSQYNFSLSKALSHIFPEMGIDESKFHNLPRNYWSERDNRRKFFEDYAKENQFDPLIASNWYEQHIAQAKGVSGVLAYYKYSPARALLDLFPSIGLEESKFLKTPNKYWHEEENRKKFFESIAVENGFDSLVPDNWYSNLHKVKDAKGGRSILSYYGNFPNALEKLFPSMSFDRSKFRNKPEKNICS